MKKKHRDIMVNNQQYGWIVRNAGMTIDIYKDKKVIHTEEYKSPVNVTTKTIMDIIKSNVHVTNNQ